MRSRTLLRLGAGLALALLAPWGVATATTMRLLDLENLSGQAELIVTGTAVSREVVASRDGRYPFTFVTFKVDEVLKGQARDRQLVLRFDGGDLGAERLVVHGIPELVSGERYLLFLQGNGRLACPIVGWWQGHFRFAPEPRSQRTVLVDHRGQSVSGIAGERWRFASPDNAAQSKVLAVEGMKVSPLPAAPPAEASPADRVIAELRIFLRDRKARPGYSPGRLVESARTMDVPPSVVWSAAPAPLAN